MPHRALISAVINGNICALYHSRGHWYPLTFPLGDIDSLAAQLYDLEDDAQVPFGWRDTDFIFGSVRDLNGGYLNSPPHGRFGSYDS